MILVERCLPKKPCHIWNAFAKKTVNVKQDIINQIVIQSVRGQRNIISRKKNEFKISPLTPRHRLTPRLKNNFSNISR